MAKPRKIPIQEAAHAVIAIELGVQVHYATSKLASDFPGRVEHGDATARQGAMIAMAGPMAVAMAANIEYNLDWACEFDELWSFLRTLADERGILLASDNPSEERIHRAERRHGPFRRSITLPSHVKPEAIEASTQDGVLRIMVPKAEEVHAKRIQVRVGGGHALPAVGDEGETGS